MNTDNSFLKNPDRYLRFSGQVYDPVRYGCAVEVYSKPPTALKAVFWVMVVLCAFYLVGLEMM